MGEIRYRVTVSAMGQGEIAMELFEAQSDAKAYMEDYLKEEDNILEGMSGAYTVTMEELFNGQWTVSSRKLVRI